MRQRFHKSSASERFGLIWKLTKLTPCLALVAGCGDVTGRRAEAPPLPTIEAGRYTNSGGQVLDENITDRWFVDLPDLTRSRSADVVRCQPDCRIWTNLSLRVGLNGVSVSIAQGHSEGNLDLAIRPQGSKVNLTFAEGGELREVLLDKIEISPTIVY